MFDSQKDNFIKDVTRTNKKEFISSLMSDNVLLAFLK